MTESFPTPALVSIRSLMNLMNRTAALDLCSVEFQVSNSRGKNL